MYHLKTHLIQSGASPDTIANHNTLTNLPHHHPLSVESGKALLTNSHTPEASPSSPTSIECVDTPIFTLSGSSQGNPMETAYSFDKVRWDKLLHLYANGRNKGHFASDYMPFDAIAPFYLKDKAESVTWVLGAIRGNIPSEDIKLTKGDAICLQHISRMELSINPECPTLFCTIGNTLWHEIGYHICECSIHLFSCDTITHIDIRFFLIAIPKDYTCEEGCLLEWDENSIGQRVDSGTGQVLPPLREWEEVVVWRNPRINELIHFNVVERSKLVEDWVERQLL